MKQYITKEQWDELDEESQIEFKENITFQLRVPFKPNISQMIEFLGDDIADISNEIGNWYITMFSEKIVDRKTGLKLAKQYEAVELIDALWEAVREEFNGD